MTAQQIFDLVAERLLKQGERAVDDKGKLFYRGPGDLVSPMGCLIPDCLYRPEMEGKTVHALMNEFPSVSELLGWKNIELIFQLQMIHDIGHPNNWRSLLLTIAAWYDINSKSIE